MIRLILAASMKEELSVIELTVLAILGYLRDNPDDRSKMRIDKSAGVRIYESMTRERLNALLEIEQVGFALCNDDWFIETKLVEWQNGQYVINQYGNAWKHMALKKFQ